MTLVIDTRSLLFLIDTQKSAYRKQFAAGDSTDDIRRPVRPHCLGKRFGDSALIENSQTDEMRVLSLSMLDTIYPLFRRVDDQLCAGNRCAGFVPASAYLLS